MDYQNYINYNNTVYKVMIFKDDLNKMLKKLPPYNKIFGVQITRIDDILNSYSSRDVGSKRRYDDKCKNDPIWQTYNRAYKAHEKENDGCVI